MRGDRKHQKGSYIDLGIDDPIIVLYIHHANHKAKTSGITTVIINSKTVKTNMAEKGSIKRIDSVG